MVSESGACAAVQIAFSFLVFTDIRLVPIEGWLATAMGRVRLSRSAAPTGDRRPFAGVSSMPHG
jgi:hypothetical protein